MVFDGLFVRCQSDGMVRIASQGGVRVLFAFLLPSNLLLLRTQVSTFTLVPIVDSRWQTLMRN
jgi:hypothetical protein